MEVTLTAFRKRFSYDPNKDLLGKGGFAKVYKAFDNEDELFVALKIAESGNETKYNLTNEIKRFKRLRHPNIVQHIEAYEVNTGSTDIHGFPVVYEVGILEYADGGTLADLLKSGTTDYRQIEDLAKDIINGLAYLHSNGIIHRDLKPSNILLFTENGTFDKLSDRKRAKITDFGIAKQSDSTAASTQLVGTVEYMSPEYFTTGNITTASDLWSLGVMLLEAVTGVHPFGKTTQGLSNEQIINNILNKDISSATENLTEPLKRIITDCLRREPILRPQTAEALKADFTNTETDTFSEKTQIVSKKSNVFKDREKSKTPTSLPPKWKQQLASNKKVIGISAIVLLLCFVGWQRYALHKQKATICTKENAKSNASELINKTTFDTSNYKVFDMGDCQYLVLFWHKIHTERYAGVKIVYINNYSEYHGYYFSEEEIKQELSKSGFLQKVAPVMPEANSTYATKLPLIGGILLALVLVFLLWRYNILTHIQKKILGISVVVLLLSFVGWKGYVDYKRYSTKETEKIVEKLYVIYTQTSVKFDLGDFNNFKTQIRKEGAVESFYETVSEDFDLGTLDEFKKDLGLDYNPRIVENQSVWGWLTSKIGHPWGWGEHEESAEEIQQRVAAFSQN